MKQFKSQELELRRAHGHIEILNLEKEALKGMMQKMLTSTKLIPQLDLSHREKKFEQGSGKKLMTEPHSNRSYTTAGSQIDQKESLQTRLNKSLAVSKQLMSQVRRLEEENIETRAVFAQVEELKQQTQSLEIDNQKHRQQLVLYEESIKKYDQMKSHFESFKQNFSILEMILNESISDLLFRIRLLIKQKIEEMEREKNELLDSFERKRIESTTIQKENKRLKELLAFHHHSNMCQEAQLPKQESSAMNSQNNHSFCDKKTMERSLCATESQILSKFITKNQEIQIIYQRHFDESHIKDEFMFTLPQNILPLLRFCIDIISNFKSNIINHSEYNNSKLKTSHKMNSQHQASETSLQLGNTKSFRDSPCLLSPKLLEMNNNQSTVSGPKINPFLSNQNQNNTNIQSNYIEKSHVQYQKNETELSSSISSVSNSPQNQIPFPEKKKFYLSPKQNLKIGINNLQGQIPHDSGSVDDNLQNMTSLSKRSTTQVPTFSVHKRIPSQNESGSQQSNTPFQRFRLGNPPPNLNTFPNSETSEKTPTIQFYNEGNMSFNSKNSPLSALLFKTPGPVQMKSNINIEYSNNLFGNNINSKEFKKPKYSHSNNQVINEQNFVQEQRRFSALSPSHSDQVDSKQLKNFNSQHPLENQNGSLSARTERDIQKTNPSVCKKINGPNPLQEKGLGLDSSNRNSEQNQYQVQLSQQQMQHPITLFKSQNFINPNKSQPKSQIIQNLSEINKKNQNQTGILEAKLNGLKMNQEFSPLSQK